MKTDRMNFVLLPERSFGLSKDANPSNRKGGIASSSGDPMEPSTKRVVLIVLDGLGIGALPDAALYGDEEANSLLHCSEAVGSLPLPHLDKLGLGRIAERSGRIEEKEPIAHFGIMKEASPGKDTLTGHWEMTGLPLSEPFPTFPKGLPTEILDAFEAKTGLAPLGGYPASGTEIIEELVEEHLRTGRPIVYTSADSVFQIAAHTERFSLEALYHLCEAAREIVNPYRIARVIARPFAGTPGQLYRLPDRKDFSMPPPGETLLDVLQEVSAPVIGIGKIHDIFSGRGLSRSLPTSDNQDGLRKLHQVLKEEAPEGLIFINLNDFDTLYGHRRNAEGYAEALMKFDAAVPGLLGLLMEGDLLVVTADHGCDPTYKGTDHTREFVPLLVFEGCRRKGSFLGTRKTFADIAATVAAFLSVPWHGPGRAFLRGG